MLVIKHQKIREEKISLFLKIRVANLEMTIELVKDMEEIALMTLVKIEEEEGVIEEEALAIEILEITTTEDLNQEEDIVVAEEEAATIDSLQGILMQILIKKK